MNNNVRKFLFNKFRGKYTYSPFSILYSVFSILNPVFSILFSVFSILPLQLSASFDLNSNCQLALQAALDLRLTDARILIEREKSINPENAYPIYLEHYSTSIELIITENEDTYKELIDTYDERMDILDGLDDGSPDSKWLQAEMLFQTGLAQVKFGSRISGAYKILSSYRKIKDHRHKFPDFWQNRKLVGMFNIIFDFVPPFMRWAADLFGISGNSELGIYQLEQYSKQASAVPGLAEEAVLITTLGYKLAWQEEQGLRFIARQDKEILENTLVTYLYASTARFTYQNDLAMDLLTEITPLDLQVEFYSLDYLMGRCKLNHLEKDANMYLQKYLDRYPGPDYKKDVCNRLSFYYIILGDTINYLKYRAMIAQVGQDMRDPDQDAELESKSGVFPHVGLLKARLLCDGGYFKESKAVMDSIDSEQLTESYYRLEYNYRMGRVLQLSGYPDKAITELTKTYYDGKQKPYTYATRAALQLGKIYEDRQQFATALKWYERCTEVFSGSHTTEGVKDMAVKGVKRMNDKG